MRTWVVIGALVLLLGGRAGATSMTTLLEAEPRPATGYRKGRPIKLALVPIDWAEVEPGPRGRTSRCGRRRRRTGSS